MSTVLITGASRGIGRATALHLAAAGWDVLAGVRDADAGKELASESSRITPIDLDVTVPAHLAELDEVLPDRLDAVVNNAGIAVAGPVEALSLNDLRWQFEVNVVGQVAVTQAVLPRLRESRGRVVFVSSLNGRVSIPMSAAYNASKFAIEALADALRVELRPWGIRVILIEPGCIDTDPWRRMMDLLDEVADGMRPEHHGLYSAHLAGQRKIIARLQQQTRPAALVASAIERALTSKRPRSRQLVGLDARALVAMRAALPTRALDAIWARGMGVAATGGAVGSRAGRRERGSGARPG
jgi:NAD(P)-dependent dehydrogenase (short-subunit alcohol dehydrogenase family)